MRRIPWQPHGIDGMESPVRQAGARRTAIEQCLINVNAFFVFRGRAMEDGEVISTTSLTERQSATLRATVQAGDWLSVILRDDAGPTLFSNAIYIAQR
ncbi:MAG TPA: hypothetical protein VE422_43490 [Terriglobia bacterium]|nr:hypothetical protein [Terriglobia bacterium]